MTAALAARTPRFRNVFFRPRALFLCPLRFEKLHNPPERLARLKPSPPSGRAAARGGGSSTGPPGRVGRRPLPRLRPPRPAPARGEFGREERTGADAKELRPRRGSKAVQRAGARTRAAGRLPTQGRSGLAALTEKTFRGRAHKTHLTKRTRPHNPTRLFQTELEAPPGRAGAAGEAQERGGRNLLEPSGAGLSPLPQVPPRPQPAPATRAGKAAGATGAALPAEKTRWVLKSVPPRKERKRSHQ